MLIGIVDYALLIRPNKAETVVHHLARGPDDMVLRIRKVMTTHVTTGMVYRVSHLNF